MWRNPNPNAPLYLLLIIVSTALLSMLIMLVVALEEQNKEIEKLSKITCYDNGKMYFEDIGNTVLSNNGYYRYYQNGNKGIKIKVPVADCIVKPIL